MRRSSRSLKIAIAGAALVAAFVVGSSVALGGALRTGSSSAGSPRAGVVVVNTSLGYQGGAASGTGIVLTSSGEVLTNNHVVRGATALRVTDVSTGRTYSATVAGYGVSKDIALLKLDNAQGLTTATIGSSSGLRVGDPVTAIGNAGGAGVLSTTNGKLTGLGRAITVSDDAGGSSRLTGLIATNAPLRPGDSGGPLLSHGRVIGVDAAASSDLRFRGGSSQGFAIPINAAMTVVKQIESGHRSATVHIGRTAFLGVALGQSSSGGQGVRGAIVEDVVPGSPADKAGVTRYDVITSFGGHRVSSPAKLRTLVLRVSPGRAQRLTWIDPYGTTNRATVRLVSGPPQ
jgi:S1-C subfamily serine protease